MKSSKPWILIDSGIGGLVYAEALRKNYPKISFIYISDNKNFPYGERSLTDLKTILKDLLDKTEVKFSPAGILFVCNTATVSYLKDSMPIRIYPVVGVHPFAGYSRTEAPSHNTLLLSTKATWESELVQSYRNQFPQKIKGVGLSALVKFSETGDKKWSYIAREELEILKEKLGNWQIEDVYLGCTHFIALRDWLSPFFPGVRLIDSREYSVELIKSFSVQFKEGIGKADFYLTRGSKERGYYEEKAKEVGFSFKGTFS